MSDVSSSFAFQKVLSFLLNHFQSEFNVFVGLLDHFIVFVKFKELLIFHFHFISEHFLDFLILFGFSFNEGGYLGFILLFEFLKVLDITVSLSLDEFELIFVKFDFWFD